jgi:hypothetical protein
VARVLPAGTSCGARIEIRPMLAATIRPTKPRFTHSTATSF